MPKKPIDHYEHPDTLPNNPTQELSGFAEDEENAPTRYPRDVALDPQLVWKGKDQQNDTDLEIHTVPIYTQEHIQPQAIIENLRSQQRRESDQIEMLFEGFNDLEFSQKIEFYEHEQNWRNRFISGDSLAVMNSLAEKEHLKGQVQMIYLDPPYGIKFSSNWQVSTRKNEVGDTGAEDVTAQPEQVKAFRDTWELGVHSYLAYLRDRFTIARELLTDSGSIFVQISDENVHRVRCLLDEIFGDINFLSTITWTRTNMTSSTSLASVSDYILWYAKDKEMVKYRQLWMEWDERIADPLLKSYTQVELEDGTRRGMTRDEQENPGLLPPGSRRFINLSVSSQSSKGYADEYEFQGKTFTPPGSRTWSASNEGLNRLAKQERLTGKRNALRYIRYAVDSPGNPITNLWIDTAGGRSGRTYVVETHPKVIQRCVLMATDPGDLVLDPTCGSGTTAYVAEQWGRRWITIDTSRVALALARTRLMSAKYPYYRLENTGNIKDGFIYNTAPDISLSDMANNTEIDEIHAEYTKKLDPLRTEMNRLIEQNWEEWEVPIESDPKWNPKLQKLHREWLTLKRDRQREMDKSTEKRGTNKNLYDQPYEDRKRVRVTGPFTVESLSPHFVLDPVDAETAAPTPTSSDVSQDYHQHILEHLKTGGVQNRLQDQRITFDLVDEHPGEWIHAEAMSSDENGSPQNIAISIGPQYGTVGSQWINEASKEAVGRIPKFDLLIVAGFNFEGYTAGAEMRIGSLTVLPIKMSHELMVRELKNTGQGNLFMVFGEPDVEIVDHQDGTHSVKLLGVDVYNPKKGLTYSDIPKDIACWFIDTAYNGEAFFVRHAYFTGEGEPYKQLQRALNSEIDAEAWEVLYRTESLPFAKPETGKIAVKVINHYGDEVMKEYKV
ncbi:site-specific DNA-methyltransferase [Candidatus Poribacteria bacterium]|nr:site-specific DNA-methyltransferase [Candidatus Poribacteria bacterium]MYG06267.1 site-specific DNA-methyltransferase [Candidatus Poribacteria bacterium]MYK24240.1 site-specific DNA-methyltransferase [Candidatus Poribacteria bacterium]